MYDDNDDDDDDVQIDFIRNFIAHTYTQLIDSKHSLK